MNWLVYHIASGHAFFTGVLLMLVAEVAATKARPIANRVAVLAFVVGAIAIVVSSTAIPYWSYAVAGLANATWIASRFSQSKKWRTWASWAMAAAWLIAAGLELSYHFTPSLAPAPSRAVTIVGDSITAGIGENETSETWPEILARRHHIAVQDISHVGETARSALKRVRAHEIDSPVVIVEIGGNDVLGSTTAERFARDLDALLAHLAKPGRQIVMFELPLPPFSHEFGRVQRAVAKRYGVVLVPKRVLLSVIAGSGATIDSLHLTEAGHREMAQRVWGILWTAF
jgi:acyl-CoA thioesterase-1